MEKLYKGNEIAEKIIDFCLGKYKFIFISGNGGSGKTTLSKQIMEEINQRGLEANCIDMDDFMIDSKIRKNTQKEWIDSKNNKRLSYHTWAFKESYHMDHLEEIVHSFMQGKDSFYKSKNSNELTKIKREFPLTIIEGVGTVFLNKEENAYGIFVMCDFKTEIERRISRARDGENDLSREEVEARAIERNEQFEVTILPKKNNFDLELTSYDDFSLNVERDNFAIF